MAEILKCIVCVCMCEVFSWNAFVNVDLYVQYQPILVSCSDPPVYLYNVRACYAALAKLGSLANERVVFTQIMNCAQRVATGNRCSASGHRRRRRRRRFLSRLISHSD